MLEWIYGEQNDLHRFLADRIQKAGAQAVITVKSSDDQTNIENYLTSGGVPLTNIVFAVVPWTYSIWARDWAAQTIYHSATKQAAQVDWKYFYPENNSDDSTPDVLAPLLGLDLYKNTAIDLEGGNAACDGFGTIVSDERLVINQGRQPVSDAFLTYLGVTRLITLPTVENEAIPHIDEYLKFLDEETILYGRPSNSIIENNIRTLRFYNKSVYGRPYRFVKVNFPDPDPQPFPRFFTYTNSLIVNNSILVPLYGKAEDDAALQTIREAMPGYNVEGFDCYSIIGLGGAIHCITHEVNNDKIVRIAHPHFLAPRQAGDVAEVRATIWSADPVSQVNVWIERPGESVFTSYPMTQIDATTFSYSLQSNVIGDIKYYIEAEAGGVKGYKPPNGPQGGYYVLSYANDFLQVKSPTKKRTIFGSGSTTYLSTDIEMSLGELSGLKFHTAAAGSGDEGFCWRLNGSAGMTGVSIEDFYQKWLNDPQNTQGGLVIKKDGVTAFYVSTRGDIRFGNQMFTCDKF